MTVLEELNFNYPVLRVNNRDLNIAFYENQLGMNCYYEENAIALLSGHGQQVTRFVIEESPSVRTRAVEGPKKLNKLIIKAKQAADIAALLALQEQVDQVFQGSEGYAFQVTSPEGDVVLLHAEENLTSLVPIDCPNLSIDPDFKGLADFVVEEFILNVKEPERAQAFYNDIFEGGLPLKLSFVEADGPDLELEPNIAWDLEILEFAVSRTQDMQALKTYFEGKGLSVYLDRKETVLVISDISKIELWFKK